MRNPWLDIRGPFAAMIATLARLNWRAPSATTLRTESGQLLDLEKVSPKEVAKEVALSTQAGVWKEWTLEASGAGFSKPFLLPVKRLVAKKREAKGPSNTHWPRITFRGEEFSILQVKYLLMSKTRKSSKLCLARSFAATDSSV